MLQRSFPEELKLSKQNEHIDASHQNLQLDNKLIFLDPYIDTEEIMCVGNRLNKITLQILFIAYDCWRTKWLQTW